jgi:sulfotransferase
MLNHGMLVNIACWQPILAVSLAGSDKISGCLKAAASFRAMRGQRAATSREDCLPKTIHFISGLPRAGSTLLSAILLQNPRFHAGITSPVGSLYDAMLRGMGNKNESAVFITDVQRDAMLRAIFDAYYAHLSAEHVVFDTNRLWCARLPSLTALFPKARIICCVRDVPWILDSVERIIRQNKFEPSGIFNFEPGGTVYSRIDGLSSGAGMVGFAWNALREAFYGDQADRLVLVTYETLTTDPRRTINAIYDFIGEPHFTHDFENVAFDASEFDRRLGTPGLHSVRPRVAREARETILPPDIVRRTEGNSFWREPSLNPRNVPII